MDRKTFKSKPYHTKTKHNGEIEKTVHSAQTEIGTSASPANFHVHGAATFTDFAVSANALMFGHRLSASGSSPVPSGNVPSASVLYLSPYTSQHIGLYVDNEWRVKNAGIVTGSLSTLSATNTNYDVFAYWNSAKKLVELDFASWSGDTTRATALASQDGVLTKANDPTRRYVGTVRTIAAGVVADTNTRRFVWNYYNRRQRPMEAQMGLSWNYSSTTWRYAGSGTASIGSNCFAFVCGDVTDAAASVFEVTHCTSNAHMEVGVGLDSAVPISKGCGLVVANVYGTTTCRWDGHIGTPGYHFLAWLEHGENLTGTFYGFDATIRPGIGMQGVVWA